MSDKKATVLFDHVGFKDADGNRMSAAKGEEVSLSAEEFARLEALGAIESPGASKAKSGTVESVEEGVERSETDKPEDERAAHADPSEPPPEAPGGALEEAAADEKSSSSGRGKKG